MTTIYTVLRRPLFTEKSNYQNSELHQYTFEVDERCYQDAGEGCNRNFVRCECVRVNVSMCLPSAAAVGATAVCWSAVAAL
jgi:large subunit ribosomal protein L23